MTAPNLPDRGDLERLNLKLAWSTSLPMEGRRDSIATVQLVDQLLIVQLRSGFISVHDSETGRQVWGVRPGGSFPAVIPEVAADERQIIAVRDVRMYGMNRQNGRVEWTYELPTIPSSAPTSDGDRVYVSLGGVKLFAYELPGRGAVEKVVTDGLFVTSKLKLPTMSPAGKPQVADSQVPRPTYESGDARFMRAEIGGGTTVAGALALTPSISTLESVNPPYRINSNRRQLTASLAVLPSAVPPFRLNSDVSSTPGMTMVNNITRLEEMSQKNTPPQALKERWALTTLVRLPFAPRVTSGGVVAVSSERAVIASPKLVAQEFYRFEAAANISSPAVQFGDTLFLPTIDSSLYAIDGLRGRLLWRYTADAPLAQPAAVIGDDIYITTVGHQLYRLDRSSGDSHWKDRRGVLDRSAPDISRFLAASDRVVFAADEAGNLVVLDRRRGMPLGTMASREFTVRFANSVNDRIYLGAHNGLFICLHDRDLASPQLHPQRDPNAPTSEAPAESKPVERPKKPLPGLPPAEKPKENKDEKKDG